MEKDARIFRSFAEAEQAEMDYYRSLTNEQRLQILVDLIAQAYPHESQQRLEEFVELLNSRKIKYLVVGGYAVACHGFPRFTGDIDFLIETTPHNASLVAQAIKDFGFASLGLGPDDFRISGLIIQLGRPPNRIDLLTSISGVAFNEAWESRIESTLDGLAVNVIGRELLVRNKLATARPQDLADVAKLGGKI